MSKQKVVIYTSNNCERCEKVTSLLSNKGIPFEERNVSENASFFKKLKEMDIFGTPATFVNDTCILGFQKERLETLLNSNGNGNSIRGNYYKN